MNMDWKILIMILFASPILRTMMNDIGLPSWTLIIMDIIVILVEAAVVMELIVQEEQKLMNSPIKILLIFMIQIEISTL